MSGAFSLLSLVDGFVIPEFGGNFKIASAKLLRFLR